MRMLEYEVKLAERGYVVVSGDMRKNPDLICECECLPISLTPGPHDTNEGLIAAVSTDASCAFDCQEDDFCENYSAILLGQHPQWYLYCFEVHAGEIILEYYNLGTGGQSLMMLHPKRGSVLDLQFDVPHQNGKHGSRYFISISEKYAKITEPTDGMVLREISIVDSDDGTAHRATISEFVDL